MTFTLSLPLLIDVDHEKEASQQQVMKLKLVEESVSISVHPSWGLYSTVRRNTHNYLLTTASRRPGISSAALPLYPCVYPGVRGCWQRTPANPECLLPMQLRYPSTMLYLERSLE